jgi:hypothetical protein
MARQNRQTKTRGYELIWLSVGGLVLGSAIPIYASMAQNQTKTAYLLAMEIVGTITLIYVFAAHVLKK